MDFNLLVEADKAGFALEQARLGLEAAKTAMELCKQSYEDIILKAEEAGIPRAKFKKIVEERVQSLFDNGFAEVNVSPRSSPRIERPKRAKKSDPPIATSMDIVEPAPRDEAPPELSGEA